MKILTGLSEIKNNFINSNKNLLNFNFNSDVFSTKQEKYLLKTLEKQGFQESIFHNTSFYQSARKELSYHLKKEDIFFKKSKNILSIGTIYSSFNENSIKVDKKMDGIWKDYLIDYFIQRKSIIKNGFVEAILLPLDNYIAKSLNYDIEVPNDIQSYIDENNLPENLIYYINNLKTKNVKFEDDKFLKSISRILKWKE